MDKAMPIDVLYTVFKKCYLCKQQTNCKLSEATIL